ncbi:MAG: hypothetical protein KatS3mg050_1197 [Litorilinea sp.]|nr:MAG: hypothetical protein KatS3mg050_1197 [Litorilinea sp.]
MSKSSDWQQGSFLLRVLQRLRVWQRLGAEQLAPALERLRLWLTGIVTQGPLPLKPEAWAVSWPRGRRLRQWAPITVQVGFWGVLALVMWWSWPHGAGTPMAASSSTWSRQGSQASSSPASLAIVNPANLTTPQAAATPAEATRTEDSGESSGLASREPAAGSAMTVTVTAAATGASGAPWPQEIVVVTPTAAQPEAESPASAQPDLPVGSPLVIPVDLAAPSQEVGSGQASPTPPLAEAALLPLPTPTPLPVPPTPDPSRLITEEVSSLPTVAVVSLAGVPLSPTVLPPTATPEPTPTPSPTPTRVPSERGPGRLWSTFTPRPAAENDHFWIGRPFANIRANQQASPNYQFGSTAGNRYRPHHGLDISNPVGTPIRAGVTGTVVHAGPDDVNLLGPYNNFYGLAVVIRLDRRLPVAGGELDVYVLYGHLSDVRVQEGQHVQPDDVVGLVGMTGIAIGPHLHVEVRLGANTYQHNVNPYLWLEPEEGNGVVAVRLLTANGRTWAGARLSLTRFAGGVAVWSRQIETYLDTEQIGPDPAWGENGAMGDVPAGHYYLVGTVNGESIRVELDVEAGATTFVEIRTSQ